MFWNVPRFVVGILNLARRIYFFLFCNEELNYENYIEKGIGDKECSLNSCCFFVRVRGSISGRRIFCIPQHPGQLWGTPRFNSSGKWGHVPGSKAAEAWT